MRPFSSFAVTFARGPLVVVLLVACAGTKEAPKVPSLPRANAAAVSKMARGVEAARRPEGRQRAMAFFEEAVQVDASLWEAHYDLGILNAESGNLAVAERELDRAFRLAPNAEDVAIALAEVRLRRKDPTHAVAALEAFVKSHPRAVFAPIALMAALREAGRVDAAIELAHRILIRRARDPHALAELAILHLARGEIDTAEILIREALKADPKSAIAERTAGLVALKKGDDAVAFLHFAKATELDPTDTTARLNTGTVLLAAGVYERAAEQFRAVHEADPKNAAATLGLAAARRGLGKKDRPETFAEVERLLKSVLEREPNNLPAIFNLAVLYAEYLKRPGEAEALFRRFRDDAPESHPARSEVDKWLSARGAPVAASEPAKKDNAPAPAAKSP